MPTFSGTESANGYLMGEVASAFQKMIRRGREDDALFWGVELHTSGFAEYAWKRMRIIASEDVGLADPGCVTTIRALYENFTELARKKDEVHAPERLFFVHAILYLCRAPKNRSVDHALIYHWANHAAMAKTTKIPDVALDKHTAEGRKRRRGWEHFFTEGIKLEPETGDDPWREKAREAMERGLSCAASAASGQPKANQPSMFGAPDDAE